MRDNYYFASFVLSLVLKLCCLVRISQEMNHVLTARKESKNKPHR